MSAGAGSDDFDVMPRTRSNHSTRMAARLSKEFSEQVITIAPLAKLTWVEPDREGGPQTKRTLPDGRVSDTYKCFRKNVAIFHASIAFQGISPVV